MKNLKKALSMVLASAMLFGMMVVGTGAAYADVKDEHNEEAIGVVSMVGIMGANDEFNPDAKITRNEMAVVMVNMLGLDTDDFAGASQFTDVPAWAADYVDACYANGIVSGVSATEFNGAANVTTAEAALMVMKALGYFQFSSDFEGDWLLATIKQASKIDLLEGIEAKSNAALTRNEVAQLVLNALESVVVVGEQLGNTTEINAGDVSVTVTSKTLYTKQTNATKYDAEGDGYEYLVEKLYGTKVTKNAATAVDAYGRPATKWEYRKSATETKSVTVADEAYAIYVNSFNSEIIEDLEDADIVLPETVTYNKADVLNVDDLYVGKTAVNGYTVELFDTDDNNKTIEKIVVIESNFATVTDVELTEDKDEGYVELTVSAYPSDVVLTFTDDLKKSNDMYDKLAGFEKDDVLVVTMNWETDEPIAFYEPEAVTGKITKIKSGAYNCTTKATIDGVTYEMNNLFVDAKNLSVGDEGTLYLDAEGVAIGWTEKKAAAAEYAYVLAVDTKSAEMFETEVSYFAKLLYVDGSVEIVEITKADYDAHLTGFAVSYSKITSGDDKGKIDLDKVGGAAANKTITKGEVLNNKLSGKYVLNNKTVFIVETVKDKVSTYTVYTGVANVPTLTASNVAFVTKDGAITTVFAMTSELATEAETSKDLTYLANVSAAISEEIDDETVTYYTYDAIVNGKITTVEATDATLAGVMYKKLSLDDNGMIDGVTATKQSGDKIVYVEDVTANAAAKDGVIKLGGTNYLYDDATVVYKVDADGITKTTIAKVAAGNKVDFYTYDGTIAMIIIEPAAE